MFAVLGLAVLALAIVAVVRTSAYERRLRELEARLVAGEMTTERLERQLFALRGALPKAAPPSPEQPHPTQPEAVPSAAPPDASARDEQPAEPAAGPASVPPIPPVSPPSGPPRPATSPAADEPSLEEWLGTRWAVWIGGVALALGGLLLARYTIEQGLIGPGVRIVLGLVFAAALVAAGEWFRRAEQPQPVRIIPAAHIPSVLTAAGTVTAFGTIYAAHALYDFIGPAAAFVLLGLVGVGTMLAAALHGPALAGLGLVGAYVAPLLVSTAKPSPWPVVVYLAVVAAAAMGLARLRHWLWLANVAVVGAFLWGLPYADRMAEWSLTPRADQLDWQLAGFLHALVQMLLAAAFIAVLPNRSVREEAAMPDGVTLRSLGPLCVLAVLMIAASRFDLAASIPFTLAAAGILLGTAWLSPPGASAAVLAGIVVLAGVINWPGLAAPPPDSLLSPVIAGVLRLPENVWSFLAFAACASLGVSLIAGIRLMRGRTFPVSTAGLYALAATATPLLALVLAYLRVKQFDASIHYGLAGVVLAALFALATDRFQRLEIPELPGTRLDTGAFAAAAIAALCFALVALLERGYLTVALAMTALGTATIAVRRDIPLLRHVVSVLAAVVLARIAWDPRIMGADVGRMPVLNWLLVGYGIPAAAFWQSARVLETKGHSLAPRIADAAAVLLAGLLCFFEIHHALHGGDALAPTTGHVEQGLLATIALGFSLTLMRMDLGRANLVFHWGAMAFGALSAIIIVIGLGLERNPLFSGERVGGPVVASTLLLGYLLPGLAAAILARAARTHRPAWYVSGIAVLALLLVFGYVTLEVRHIFQGARIDIVRRTLQPEQWAYSVAWLVLGVLFLAYGIVRGSLEARIASAALVMLSVLKVFVVDLAGLTGLWRALSLIVLGLVLIGIGLVYQKLVFARPRPAAAGPTPPAC